MQLLSAQIIGFQSFSNSGYIQFAEGINLLVGQNNAGKSSILRALRSELADDRHRTPDRWENSQLPRPELKLSMRVSGEELKWAVRVNGGEHAFPVPEHRSAINFVERLLDKESIDVNIIRNPSKGTRTSYPGHGLFEHKGGHNQYYCRVLNSDGAIKIYPPISGDLDGMGGLINNIWDNFLFYFSPERFAVGISGHGRAHRLNPDASNLPAFLHTLNGEKGSIFEKLINHLREIFSTVGYISVAPQANGQLEIRVWPTDKREALELSFSLNSSGTGVAQVIAILAAVMTSRRSVIIIDEINSFLHPSAVKSLIRILKTEYYEHQYIISTHSPDVISFSNPGSIHLIKRIGYESSVRALDLCEIDDFREIAEHLGVSMADVFAADRVVWVEGPTEELCFPYLFQKLVGPLPRGVVFTSVVATGDFISKRRDREFVYRIYQRLSTATATLLVSVAFSFDSEDLSEEEKARMCRESQGLVHFLPRRHLECYLVDPAAICHFILSKDEASADTVSPESVAETIRSVASDGEFRIAEWGGRIDDEAWLAKVDAAKIINHVCNILSHQRVRFTKKEDSLMLLQKILSNNPIALNPLRDYVRGLVEVGNGG